LPQPAPGKTGRCLDSIARIISSFNLSVSSAPHR
jgi:hypothetical protein